MKASGMDLDAYENATKNLIKDLQVSIGKHIIILTHLKKVLCVIQMGTYTDELKNLINRLF